LIKLENGLGAALTTAEASALQAMNEVQSEKLVDEGVELIENEEPIEEDIIEEDNDIIEEEEEVEE
jgi:hypothetical protein